MADSGIQPPDFRRRATLALLLSAVLLLATCLLWFTTVEGNAFLALQIGRVALSAGCGIAAADFARRAGTRRTVTIAITFVVALFVGSILFVLLLIEFASRFE